MQFLNKRGLYQKTYELHYTSDKGNYQTLDLIESIGDAEAFARSNAIKYLSRFGKKDGKNRKDILKMHSLLYTPTSLLF